MNEQVLGRGLGEFDIGHPRNLIFLSQMTADCFIERTSDYHSSLGKCENKVNQKEIGNPDLSVPVYPIFNLNI